MKGRPCRGSATCGLPGSVPRRGPAQIRGNGRPGDFLGLALAAIRWMGCREPRGSCGLLPSQPTSRLSGRLPSPTRPSPSVGLHDEAPGGYRSSRLRLNILPFAPPGTRDGSPTSAAPGRQGAWEQEMPPLLPGAESAPCAPPRLPSVSVATRRAPRRSRAGQGRPEGIGQREHQASSFSSCSSLALRGLWKPRRKTTHQQPEGVRKNKGEGH